VANFYGLSNGDKNVLIARKSRLVVMVWHLNQSFNGDQNWPRPNLGASPRPLGECGFTIKPTLPSFCVFFPWHMRILFVSSKQCHTFWRNFEENGILFEGFEVHDATCENIYVLDFRVGPLGRPQYQFQLHFYC
jgi:hypothetical protein